MIRKRTPARVRHIIAQKVAMKRRWENDPDGMLRRSKAGAKAMSDLAEKHRTWWSNWLHDRARRLTKAQLIDGITKTIQDEGRRGHTKPASMLARLVRYGFVRFDPVTFDYINERSQETA